MNFIRCYFSLISKFSIFFPLYSFYAIFLKDKKEKKRIDIGCNAAPLTEKEEENGKYTLWSMFNMKITINHNGLLWGSACCVYQGGACVPHRSFIKPKLENGVNIVSIDRIVLFFFFLWASESVYHLVWNEFQSIKSFDGI